MKRTETKAFMPLDQEKKELMESLDNDEWETVADFAEEKSALLIAARNTLKKISE